MNKTINEPAVENKGLLPIEFFKTPNSYYAFDPTQIVFLEIDELTYNLLSHQELLDKDISEIASAIPGYSEEELRETLEDIKDIQDQDFLRYREFSRSNPYTMPEIKKHLNGSLQSLYLNITSKCNLNCSYCVYGGNYANFDSLNNMEMSWETAQKAIDFLLPKTSREGTLRIDFFGGEPLLSFPLIKRIVAELKERMKGRDQKLKFCLCTNGTVMNDDILEFLLENNFHLQISIDGDKELHDSKRRFRGVDRGSYDKILENLQVIYQRNPDYFTKQLKLKSVITTDSLKADGEEFFKHPLIKILNDEKSIVMIHQNPQFNVEKDDEFFASLKYIADILLQKRNISTLDELKEGFSFHMQGLFYSTFYEFLTVQIIPRIYFDRDDPVPFGKDCLIGVEGCVNVDGSISVCYKANSFIIGNVHEQAWYFDKIEEYHTKRYSPSGRCKHCFIQRFCNLCYEGLSTKGNGMEESIKNFCNFKRQYYRLIFGTMLQVMENNPNLWDVLQELKEKEEKLLEIEYKNNLAKQSMRQKENLDTKEH